MKIGLYDSGAGGLTVLNEAMNRLPHEEFVFYADTENVPYGEKTVEEIREYAKKAVSFLVEHDCKIVVVACNTATSAAIEYLRETFPIPIIGMEPAVKVAMDENPQGKILVLATNVTVHGDKMKHLLEKYDKDERVVLQPMPGLVELAENCDFGIDAEEYINNQLYKYDLEEFSAIVLGCTHFTYFKDVIRCMVPDNIRIVDGNAGTVKQLVRKLSEGEMLENNLPSLECYASGKPFSEALKYKMEVLLKRAEDMHEI